MWHALRGFQFCESFSVLWDFFNVWYSSVRLSSFVSLCQFCGTFFMCGMLCEHFPVCESFSVLWDFFHVWYSSVRLSSFSQFCGIVFICGML